MSRSKRRYGGKPKNWSRNRSMERGSTEYAWVHDDNKDVSVEISETRGRYTAVVKVPSEMGVGRNGNLTQRIIGNDSNKRELRSDVTQWQRNHPSLVDVMQYLRTQRRR